LNATEKRFQKKFQSTFKFSNHGVNKSVRFALEAQKQAI